MLTNVLPVERGSHREARPRSSLLALVLVVGLILVGAEAWAWQTTLSGTGSGAFYAAAVDSAGNVIAAGATSGYFTVVKLDGATGTELWRQTIKGASSGSNFAQAVAVDEAGNVVAAGSLTVLAVGETRIHAWTVIKFDGASGTELWRETTDTSDRTPVARAVAIDGAGNVLAAGLRAGGFQIFMVRKYDGASGALVWEGQVSGGTNPVGQGKAVAVDGAGNVVAAGVANTGGNFVVATLDGSSGGELWVHSIPCCGIANACCGVANALAIDGANVVAAGRATNKPQTNNFAVVKLDGASGAELWRQAISLNASAPEAANAVAVDEDGGVVAAGVTGAPGPGTNFTVVKFNGADGAELWRLTVNGTASNSLDQALAVAVDRRGDVAAAGTTQNTSGSITSSDFTVVKVDGESGEELWRQVIGSAPGTNGGALAVRVDAACSVIVAGTVSNLATVVKLEEAPPRHASKGDGSEHDRSCAGRKSPK
ncbi:MAG: hypothetical protein DME09_01890 [Candidatus Rokuibacteriota bacterium]|nr:MAG: hypothetical protein DME09_01890 [Candidatus Rokubacteria bacterium]